MAILRLKPGTPGSPVISQPPRGTGWTALLADKWVNEGHKIAMNCPVCGKEYNGRNKYTCSMACFAQYKTQIKTCVVCGEQFNAPRSSATVTCSPECSHVNRQQHHEKGIYDGMLEKAHEVAKTNPLTGRFDTHMHAKTWKLQAPDGTIHECRNLKNWLRDHADLLDGSVTQAWSGIAKIKYSMQGKRKNINYQWKGWRLLEWGEK